MSRTSVRPRRAVLTLAIASLVIGGLWLAHGHQVGLAVARLQPPVIAQPLDANAAELMARRVIAAHGEVTGVWRRDFARRLGREYRPPELVVFLDTRPSPCAGAALMTGPAYCAIDRTLAADLAFLDRLAAQLRAEGTRAVALVIARLGAEHVRAELGLPDEPALGDCLTGVWVRRTEARLGPVELGSWGRLVAAARLVAPEAAASARLAEDSVAEREAAFAAGYAHGQVRACLELAAPGTPG